MAVDAGGGHPLGLVDHDAGEIALALVKRLQALQKLFIGEPARARHDDALRHKKLFGGDDGVEGVVFSDP